MPKIKQHNSGSAELSLLLKAFNAADIAFAIKDVSLEYVHHNECFATMLGIEGEIKNDFDVYIPEVAYELGQEENQLLVSQKNQELERIIISKAGSNKIVKIKRSLFFPEGDENPFITIVIEDITEISQDQQFDEMKKVLSKEEVFEKILNQFSNLIFRTSDRKEILEGVCKLGVHLLGLEDIAIYTAGENNDLLQQAVYGKDEKLYYNETGNITLKSGEGICGTVFKDKEVIICNNLDQEPNYVQGLIDAKSELCVPIIYKGEVLGVIDSESSQYNFYTKERLKQVESVASLLAIKLHELDFLSSLQDRQHALATFIEQSPSTVAQLNKKFEIVIASKNWIDTFMDGNTDVVGKTLHELNPNFNLKEIKKLDKALTGKEVQINHQTYITPNGKKLWIEGHITPWSEDGEIKGLTIYVKDVTKAHERLLKLDQSNEQLSEAQSLGKINKWSFDPNLGTFKWESGRLAINSVRFGEDMPSEEVFDLIPEDHRNQFYQVLDEAITNHEPFEFIHPIMDGEKQIWLRNKGKVVVENGSIKTIEGIAMDITSEIDAENTLREKVEELEKLNSQLDQFVYKTAHDLRAPLNNVAGLINVMKNVTDISLMGTYLELQEQSIQKLDKFILSIGTFTKNARLPVKVDLVNMPVLVDEVLNDYLYVPNSDKVQKMVNIQRGVEYFTDKTRFDSILRNLIDNAIQYADLEKEQPYLNIEIKRDNSSIILNVSDNGVGIPEKVLNRAFEMFYRGSNLSQGAGIGLYIVQESVKKLNGIVTVSADDKEGTVVKVELPHLAPE